MGLVIPTGQRPFISSDMNVVWNVTATTGAQIPVVEKCERLPVLPHRHEFALIFNGSLAVTKYRKASQLSQEHVGVPVSFDCPHSSVDYCFTANNTTAMNKAWALVRWHYDVGLHKTEMGSDR